MHYFVLFAVALQISDPDWYSFCVHVHELGHIFRHLCHRIPPVSMTYLQELSRTKTTGCRTSMSQVQDPPKEILVGHCDI